MEMGLRIKARRKELKMSADELAARLGKDRSTVYRYENGDIANMPLELLGPLATALETTPYCLLGWNTQTEDLMQILSDAMRDPELRKLVQAYTELEQSDKDLLLRLAESMHDKTNKSRR